MQRRTVVKDEHCCLSGRRMQLLVPQMHMCEGPDKREPDIVTFGIDTDLRALQCTLRDASEVSRGQHLFGKVNIMFLSTPSPSGHGIIQPKRHYHNTKKCTEYFPSNQLKSPFNCSRYFSMALSVSSSSNLSCND